MGFKNQHNESLTKMNDFNLEDQWITKEGSYDGA